MSARGSAPRLRALPPPQAVQRAPRRRRTADELSVVEQIRTALLTRRHRLAAVVGLVIGGFVPAATFCVAHRAPALVSLPAALALGGLLFSAPTVYGWARAALGSGLEGFRVLLSARGYDGHGELARARVARVCGACAARGGQRHGHGKPACAREGGTMKSDREFAGVLDAVLAEVPAAYRGLRAELERLKLAAPYVAPECGWTNWRALASALQNNLTVPPKHPWEERIRFIMLGVDAP